MGRTCKVIGIALAAVGLAAAAAFVIMMARDDAYRRAELAYRLNAGNAMYELEFRGAEVRRAFQGIGVVAGILLALNGATLLGLGVVATRMSRETDLTGSPRPR
jgi:peptidoglycan/LPS O-acetylase OafA/YrhL